MPPRFAENDRRAKRLKEREAEVRKGSVSSTADSGSSYSAAKTASSKTSLPSPTKMPKPTKTPKPRGNRKRPQSQAGGTKPSKKQKTVTFEEQEEGDVVEDEVPGDELDEKPKKKSFYQDEPEYLDTYDHIKAKLIELFGRDAELDKDEKQDGVYQEGLVAGFAREYFNFTASSKSEEKLLEHLCKMDVSSALLIGCVADGGPGATKGWLQVFTDPFERRQMVVGIIGMVLNEHVFSSLCYGATPEQLLKLHEEVDLKYRLYDPDSEKKIPEDGFTRAKRRFKVIRSIISADSNPLRHFGLPPDFITRSKLLAWQLHTLLKPILSLAKDGRTKHPHGRQEPAMIKALFAIATKAGLLALQMRLDRHTVYYAHSAYKDEFWAEDEMRAFNRAQMVKANPTRQDYGGDEAKTREAQGKLALVRYTLAPGWKAYKKGGWRKGDKEKGVRVTDISKAWVGLRWGWQRRWETVEQGKARLEKAKAAEKKGEGKMEEDKEGFEEWLTIWAENREDKSELKKIQGWFGFNDPLPGKVFESDDVGGDGDL